MTVRERFRGAFLGLAAGDALGATNEFKPRGTFPIVRHMTGGGAFNLPAGAWTDDTSMALCLAVSIAELGQYDSTDVMSRWLKWWRRGYLSSTLRAEDIGNATKEALGRYEREGSVYQGKAYGMNAGNGPLMRLLPIPLAYSLQWEKAMEHAVDQTRLTHGSEAKDASMVMTYVLLQLLAGAERDAMFAALAQKAWWGDRHKGELGRELQSIARGDYMNRDESRIIASGYSVATLEAALWCFVHTESLEEALIEAVNLGDDADTVGAVTGAIAGAYYGEKAIPAQWYKHLFAADAIVKVADALYLLATQGKPTPGLDKVIEAEVRQRLGYR